MANKIYALVGPYGSGKKTLIKRLQDMGIHYIPLYCTGTPTKNKHNRGLITYIDKTEFAQQEWIVRVTYKGAYYGIAKNDMLQALRTNRISVVILEQNGIKQVDKLINSSLETIYLMVDYISLVDRMLQLGNTNTDMKYHLEYAESNGEFNFWKSANHVIKNTGDEDTAFRQLMAIMGLTINVPKDILKKKLTI